MDGLLTDIDATTTESFEAAAADFSAKLLKQTHVAGKNSLVSPLSVMLALGMVASCAEGETHAEIERVLGGLPEGDMHRVLASIVKHLSQGDTLRLSIAGSLWLRDTAGLSVSEECVAGIQSSFKAEIHRAAFDKKTLRKINTWVLRNTGGMIRDMLKDIDPLALMYLVNAVAFESKWQDPYRDGQTMPGTFTNAQGVAYEAHFMRSKEACYLEDDKATGVIRPYAGGRFGFVGIMPKEGVSLEDYVASLSGESLRSLLGRGEAIEVITGIPRFASDYDIELNAALKAMGMLRAFDARHAEFGRLARYQASEGAPQTLYVSVIHHQTHIEVDEQGTKAAAATMVESRAASCAPPQPTFKVVVLDRPFVYAVIDVASGLALFVGAINDVR
ncbi:MAG: serpin family protein [Coriobacteriales bacterium]|jgi:serpin B|nr:serpin family protein [Coriobacteriales bacterium]